MTVAENLRFLADRAEDEKDFYMEGELLTFCFRNSEVMYVVHGKTGDDSLNTSPLWVNDLLGKTLKLKPQWVFTEDEKVILRSLPEQYNWIARDDDDGTMSELFAYAFKPAKFNGTWIFDKGSVTDLDNFKHLFQSIQWSDDEPCEFRKYL